MALNVFPFPISVDVTTNKTLTLADQGIVQNVTVDAVVITLPATSPGAVFVIQNGGDNPANTPSGAVADASCLVSVSPNASDKIQGNGFTAADNKDAVNTKATAKVGDRIVLVGDGVDGYNLMTVIGTWAREA